MDRATAAQIRHLLLQKKDAVRAEDYDEAKRLKEQIERLRALGSKLHQLEVQKRAAV